MNLVVMAAGMGSRFGGLKQLTPVGKYGEFLIDYSIYDAIHVGVDKVIFVIRREHYDLFRSTVGSRIEKYVNVEYAFQEMDDLPIDVNYDGRVKPWGTGQALLSSKRFVDDSFMIINADDFYGREAFSALADFFKNNQENDYAMVGYQLKNTLSDNGTVSRGICEINNGFLEKVLEKTKIGYVDGKLVNEDDGSYQELDENSLVSCNLFGFTPKIFEGALLYFKEFLEDDSNLLQKEFYLPVLVQKLIDSKKARVRVLRTKAKFSGMTYQEDLEGVKKYIQLLIDEGVYPSNLWEAEEHEK